MGHNHDHNQQTKNYSKAFAFGIILNIIFIIVEVFYGLIANSSALIADAGHNVSDVLGLIFAWFGIWLADRKPKGKYSFGFKKSTIQISLFNAIILFVAAAFILKNAIDKFTNPEPVAGLQVMIVAGIGIVINGITALLFMKGQKNDLNIKGAFLHMASDALVSLGVVVSGLLIKYTGFVLIDPITSLIIVFMIVAGTWKLFKDSIKLSIDAVPEKINLNKIKESILQNKEVESIHDLHIWALSTSENSLSVHIKTRSKETGKILTVINKMLSQDFDLKHNTIQIESDDNDFTCGGYCN